MKKEFHNLNSLHIAKSIVLEYNVDTAKMELLSNKFTFNKPNEKWSEFIFNNRLGYNYKISKFHNLNLDYDWIYGYVADGKMPIILKQFKNGNIGYEEFCSLIEPYDQFTEDQLSFHSIDAINCLTLIGIYERGVDQCLKYRKVI